MSRYIDNYFIIPACYRYERPLDKTIVVLVSLVYVLLVI